MDLEATAGEGDESHTKALIVGGIKMVMTPVHERVLREIIETLQAALALAAEEGMPPAELQQSQEFVLEDTVDIVCGVWPAIHRQRWSPCGCGGSWGHELESPNRASTSRRRASGCRHR